MRFHDRALGGRGDFRLVPLRDGLEVVHRAGALEDGGERVVIRRGQRVELVVVAARAADGHAEEGAAQRLDLLVNQVHLQLHLVRLGQQLRADAEEAQRGQLLVALRCAFGGQQVACDLFLHEAVVGFVRVEAVHHVVAVTPRVAEGDVLIKAVRVCVTRHVQPVPAPALAVSSGGEQAVDEISDCRLAIAD